MLLVERLTWNRWTMHCFQLLKRSMYHPSIHMWSSKCLLAILFFHHGENIGASMGNVRKYTKMCKRTGHGSVEAYVIALTHMAPVCFLFTLATENGDLSSTPNVSPWWGKPQKWWPVRVARNSKSPLQYVRYLMMLFTRLWIYLILLIWNIAYVTYRIKVTNCIYVFVYIGMWLKKGL